MPKQKITKEMIIETAFEIVRKEGLENLLVKNIAAKLNCSVIAHLQLLCQHGGSKTRTGCPNC